MRSMLFMDTIQIEVTNVCRNNCSNCTRYVNHYKPWFMPLDMYKNAVDSMVGYPAMTGMQGGEPLLHPNFQEMCLYLQSKIPKKQLGLWTTLPAGYEHYAQTICDTFEHIFINDHSINNVFHHSSLIAIKDVIKDDIEMWKKIDRCWAQESWSASINPNGAYFCEMAASMSMLYNDSEMSWKVEPGWWKRMVWDYKDQIEKWCPNCGMPCNLRRRSSTENIDDMSVYHYEKLKDTSAKIKSGNYKLVTNPCEVPPDQLEQLAAYKDYDYRNNIAHKYGMFLTINDQYFWTPHMIGKEQVNTFHKPTNSLFQLIKEKYK